MDLPRHLIMRYGRRVWETVSALPFPQAEQRESHRLRRRTAIVIDSADDVEAFVLEPAWRR
jgi:hypothetical protein